MMMLMVMMLIVMQQSQLFFVVLELKHVRGFSQDQQVGGGIVFFLSFFLPFFAQTINKGETLN